LSYTFAREIFHRILQNKTPGAAFWPEGNIKNCGGGESIRMKERQRKDTESIKVEFQEILANWLVLVLGPGTTIIFGKIGGRVGYLV
jgi:hypothetical protein